MATFEDTLRTQFKAMVEKKEAILAVSIPLRDAMDAKSAEINEKVTNELRPLQDQVKSAEAELYDLSNDIAALARALKGRTG